MDDNKTPVTFVDSPTQSQSRHLMKVKSGASLGPASQFSPSGNLRYIHNNKGLGFGTARENVKHMKRILNGKE